jgi:uncharacterized protein with PIN domain
MILDTPRCRRYWEPEAERFARAIENASVVACLPQATVEAAIFVDRNADEVRRAILRGADFTQTDLDAAG